MAQRRMFSLKVVDTDMFLSMPTSTRLLYYDLSMRADDDGFVESPKKIIKIIGCSEDDLKLLCAKQYIIPFETGVCVIKHWNIHNLIRHDRYTETECKNEKRQLIKEDGKYVIPNVANNGNQMEPQVRLGKVRIGKDSIVIVEKFVKPTLSEISEYANEIKFNKLINKPEIFTDYYDGNGWMVGKNKMKDWKATIR